MYRYTLQHSYLGFPSEENCEIRKDEFWPYGEVTEGHKLRGQYGFMQITKVFDEPHIKYGKFIAKSIPYEEMKGETK